MKNEGESYTYCNDSPREHMQMKILLLVTTYLFTMNEPLMV